jgi:hypothetical protein
MLESLRKIFPIISEFSLKDFVNLTINIIFITQLAKRVGVLR